MRYFLNSSFAEASSGYNPSYAWHSFMAAKSVILQGSRVQIGSRQSTIIGKDPWIPNLENGFTTTELNIHITSVLVSSLMIPSQRRWDYDLVADIFNVGDRDLILQIPLSGRRDSDK